MGHTTLGVLPKSKYWTDVAKLIAGTAGTEEIVQASARAAERDLLNATTDAVFVEAVRLLLAIPVAARSSDFADALRQIDLNVPNRPELLDLVSAVNQRLAETGTGSPSRNDFGEIAARALSETMSTMIGDALPGLFDASPDDVQTAARNLSWNKGIAEYTRRFFGTLVSSSLSYWLDRSLDTEIGTGRRFVDIAARHAFDRELDHFAWESSRIIKEFSGGWYGKTLHRDGGFNRDAAASFGHVALKKIVDDLRTRQVRNA